MTTGAIVGLVAVGLSIVVVVGCVVFLYILAKGFEH